MTAPGYIILQLSSGIVKPIIFVAVSAVIIYLSRKFDVEYAAYMKITKMFIPFFI